MGVCKQSGASGGYLCALEDSLEHTQTWRYVYVHIQHTNTCTPLTHKHLHDYCAVCIQTAQGADWFKAKVDIEVSRASEKAIDAVEQQGGRIITAHYNKLGLKLLLKPWKFEDRLQPRRALPNKKLMAYYLNPKNRY